MCARLSYPVAMSETRHRLESLRKQLVDNDKLPFPVFQALMDALHVAETMEANVESVDKTLRRIDSAQSAADVARALANPS